MKSLRTLAVLGLVALATMMAAADSPTTRMLSRASFMGWTQLRSESTDKFLQQVWRQSISPDELPRGIDGYRMVNYGVERESSRAEAQTKATGLMKKSRFNDYAAQGYAINMERWDVLGFNGSVFIVRGLSHSTEAVKAHRAEIFVFAATQENWLVWVEIRIVCTSKELDVIDRLLPKLGGNELAERTVREVLTLWNTPIKETPAPQPGTQTPADTNQNVDIIPDLPTKTTPPAATPPATTPATTTTPPAATPPATPPTTTTTPPATTPPATPPATTTPPAATPPATPPATTTTPPAATPPATPPATTPPPAATPPATPPATPTPPEPPRWRTTDGKLSLVLPQGWTATGKGPYTITGLPNASMRLLPPETYRTEKELADILKQFAADQKSISQRNFTQQSFTVDGTTGAQVRYVSLSGDTMQIYCFGKAGRLWQLEIMLPGTAATPAAITEMMNSLRLE
ncbi:MAG: hypothetical protein ACYC7E_05210 [Armatimonadota bacterium]